MERFEDLLGKTLTDVRNIDDEKLVFTLEGHREAWLYHSQDCCENVRIEEIHGDLADLIGTPILLAEEAVYYNEPDPEGRTGDPDDYRWTFYKLATVKGHVTIRWLGESNGYYGIGVDFNCDPPAKLAVAGRGV